MTGLAATAVLLASCATGQAGPLALPQPTAAPATTGEADPSPAPAPGGTVRVAYPELPAAWLPALFDDPAATDLAALWGLPLYRYDGAGQLRPVLAIDARVDAGADAWAVEVTLAQGLWSDGSPVTADDVVATVEALRTTPLAAELAPLRRVVALTPDVVRLEFDVPYGRWAHLLAGARSILPAQVLAAEGLEAYRATVPVSGGPFQLESYEPGLRASFVANRDSPAGPPRLERIEVLFTPQYETALGLVESGEASVVTGYLALNPVTRALTVAGVEAAAPLGGTWVSLAWKSDGRVGAPEQDGARRQLLGGLDLSELVEGLLGQSGARATSTIPGVDGPWTRPPPGNGNAPEGLVLALPSWQEVPGFSSRAVQRSISGVDPQLELLRVEPDELARALPAVADGALQVHRDGPWPSVSDPAAPPDDVAILAAADGADRRDGPAAADAQQRLVFQARDVPLYRVGVAQLWRAGITGLEPSSWPGTAFASAADWSLAPGGQGRQAPLASPHTDGLCCAFATPRGSGHARVAEQADAHG